MCCKMIARLNALVYYGKDIQQHIDNWDFLVDIAACRNGSVIYDKKVDDYLGLHRIRIPRCDISKYIPTEISFFTPTEDDDFVGWFHTGLVTAVKDNIWTIVNYMGTSDELITNVPRETINFNEEDSMNDRHHYLLLK